MMIEALIKASKKKLNNFCEKAMRFKIYSIFLSPTPKANLSIIILY